MPMPDKGKPDSDTERKHPAMDAETTASTDNTESATPELELANTDMEMADSAGDLDKWKSLARKHEERAKANAQAAKELAELKLSMLTDTEKALEQAKSETRRQVMAEAATRLVDAKLQAELNGKVLPAEAVLTFRKETFIDEQGEVDDLAIKAWVESHATKAETVYPDLAQGKRGTNPVALNSDPLLADLKAKLGII
jgi:hypothetical protein